MVSINIYYTYLHTHYICTENKKEEDIKNVHICTLQMCCTMHICYNALHLVDCKFFYLKLYISMAQRTNVLNDKFWLTIFFIKIFSKLYKRDMCKIYIYFNRS